MLAGTDLKGVIPPIVTPLTPDRDGIDFDGLRRVVRHVLAGGVHAIFTLGSTGNFCSFTMEERAEVVRVVVEEVAGRVPVIAGCTDTLTRLAVRHVQLANQAGADAVILEPPYLFPVGDEDVVRHYQAVAEASRVPVVIYNNPGDTKVNIHPLLVRRLARIPNIIAIKDSTLNFVGFQALVTEFAESGFQVIQGIEALAGASLLAGARGLILPVANMAPHQCVQLYEAGCTGSLPDTRRWQAQVMLAYEILREPGSKSMGGYHGEETSASFFGGLECAMSLLGICQQVVTSPYPPPSPEQMAHTRQILVELDLLKA